MVTGREIESLRRVFSRMDLFEVIVAENGAVLYYPQEGIFKPLHAPPPARFTQEMREQGVTPLSVGHVIVATREPYDVIALDLIKKYGLELQLIFNKGAVMILPTGINKATGLKAALKEKEILPENVVAVGDAENDHALLSYCGFGAAVSNALELLKAHADLVTNSPAGKGVTELIDLMNSTDLQNATPARWRIAKA